MNNKWTKWLGGTALAGVLGIAALASSPTNAATQGRPAPEITGNRWFNTTNG